MFEFEHSIEFDMNNAIISLTFNEMKYIPFNKFYINLQQFHVIPENKTQGNLINYLIFTIKKTIKIKNTKL